MAKKTNKKQDDNPALRKGKWLASFIRYATLENGHKVLVRILAGVYPTAQEAYYGAFNYSLGEEDKNAFDSPPEMLVVEWLGDGVYPDFVDGGQFVFHYIEGMGYPDIDGVTRPSYMLHHGLAELQDVVEKDGVKIGIVG